MFWFLLFIVWLIALAALVFKRIVKRFLPSKTLTIRFPGVLLKLEVYCFGYKEFVFYGESPYKDLKSFLFGKRFISEEATNPYSFLAENIYNACKEKGKLTSKVLIPCTPDLIGMKVIGIEFGGKMWVRPAEYNKDKSSSDRNDDVKESPYAVLGLKDNASLDEVKKRYLSMVKLCHPDANPENDTALITKLNAAYEQITKK